MPDARHPDVGAHAARARRATPASRSSTRGPRRRPAVGPGPVTDYLEHLTDVSPGDDPVVLPPLVTVVARRR